MERRRISIPQAGPPDRAHGSLFVEMIFVLFTLIFFVGGGSWYHFVEKKDPLFSRKHASLVRMRLRL
ncbi:unnamed protein product, partial [Onchocerca ochengi]|uniref:Uncharacterized protein n=1 Tax=Onchocerca ochengi TaxID=42157 RepID=A0A182EI59_ONCOC